MLVQQRLPYYSLGFWLGEFENGSVFAQSKGDLKLCLEKYLPLILSNFPLPIALAVPAINPKTDRRCLCIVHGGDFFEALYQFYKNELFVSTENFHWIRDYDEPLPKRLTWNTTPDIVKRKIFYTGIYVTELLSSEERNFTCAQIEEISKINFSF